MALQCKSSLSLRSRTAGAPLACRRFAPLVVRASAQPEEPRASSTVALPLAAMVAAGLLLSGLSPEEALAARSGGRVGGGSFSGARSSARSSVRQR